jgi:hypothetical protein
MPRRNRNTGTPRPDADQLAADLAQLTADLCPGLPTGHGTSTVLITTNGKQAISHLTAGSR